jgi:hypothetical protein
MTKDQIERERRAGRLAGIVGIVGFVLMIVSFRFARDFSTAEAAEQLRMFPDVKGEVLAQSLLQAASLLAFVAPLVVLFRAARARSEAVRPQLLVVTILGLTLLAVAYVIQYFAIKAGSHAFLDPSAGLDQNDNDVARNTIGDQFAGQIQLGIAIAGAIGTAFAITYTSLQATRAGLLTRFWGSLGMAVGVASIILGPVLIALFFLPLSLIVASFWPGGRPPAWEQGKAIPWPKPGEAIAGTGGPKPDPEEPARPEDFEGTAEEVPAERPGRRDNKRKRKRKQRG